jgi:hypothetical protein
LLRRIIVVGRVPQIQAIAQELAREVFVADDLREAADIITAVGPDLTIFDGTWTPAQIRAHVQEIAADATPPGPTVVVTSDGGPFGEQEYRQAGVADCFTGPAGLARDRKSVV